MAFPGSSLLKGRQVQKSVERADRGISGHNPHDALMELYGEGTDAGIARRTDLTMEQRTQLGESILNMRLHPSVFDSPAEVQALDGVLRTAAYNPRAITPETFIAIVDKFSTAYRGFATPDTVTAVAERTQTMYENGRIDDAQYKNLKSGIRFNMNSYLPDGQKVNLRAIFQGDNLQV